MIGYYDNGYGLGALSGNTVLLSDYIGKFFSVTKDIQKYSGKPGDFNIRTLSLVKAGNNIGSITEIEKASDGKYWARVSWGGWFNFNAYAPYLVKKDLAQVTLTDEQKREALLIAAKSVGGNVATGAVVLDTAEKVASGVADTTGFLLDTTAFIGKNLKTILIIAVIGAGAFYGRKIYNEFK